MRRAFALLLLTTAGCASAARPPPPPPPPTIPEPVSAPAPSMQRIDTTTSSIPIALYESSLLREFRLRNRSRPVETRTFDGETRVHAFRRIGRGRSHILITIGLGRVLRKDGQGVELLAESAEYGPPIAEVLMALGRRLHHPEAGRAFKPYGSVQLEKPEHGLMYFDLVPAGEIDVAQNHTVMLMKVVPVSAEEFEQSSEGETQFAGRDDATPEGAQKALMRWQAALDGSEASP